MYVRFNAYDLWPRGCTHSAQAACVDRSVCLCARISLHNFIQVEVEEKSVAMTLPPPCLPPLASTQQNTGLSNKAIRKGTDRLHEQASTVTDGCFPPHL